MRPSLGLKSVSNFHPKKILIAMFQVSRRALPGCLTIRQVIDVLSRTWHFVSFSLSLSACLKTRQCARHVTRRARPRGSHSREQWPGVSKSWVRAPSLHSHCEHPKEQPWRSFFLLSTSGIAEWKCFLCGGCPGVGPGSVQTLATRPRAPPSSARLEAAWSLLWSPGPGPMPKMIRGIN